MGLGSPGGLKLLSSSHRSSNDQAQHQRAHVPSPRSSPRPILSLPISLLQQRNFRPVPCVRQRFAWDCGLACVEMVIRTVADVSTEGDLFQRIQNVCQTTSVWTIDLAYALHDLGIHFTFHTVQLGVNPSYQDQEFYARTFGEDSVRVRAMMSRARSRGIHIDQTSLHLDDIIAALADNILILLVDKQHLTSVKDKFATRLRRFGTGCLPGCCFGASSFTGHYIVLYGFDPMSGRLLINDPASPQVANFVTEQELEMARHSHGTDEDILMIPKLQ